MFPTQAFQGDEHKSFHVDGERGLALLVHGFPGTPAEMRPLGRALNRSGWTVRGMLLPGFGAEIERLPHTRYDEWLGAVCREVEAARHSGQPLLLAGYSMGGALAIAAAAQIPPDALVLLAPFWKLEHVLWKALPVLKHVFRGVKPFRLVRLNFNEPDVRKGIGNFLPGADLDDPAVQAAILDLKLPLDLFAQIQQAGKIAYRSAPQVRVEMPKLVIQGRADELVRPPLTRTLAGRLRGSVTYHEVDCGHELVVESHPAWAAVEMSVTQFAQGIG